MMAYFGCFALKTMKILSDYYYIHTEVRWLSKGNCLQRFYELFDTVVQFFEDNANNISNDLKRIKHHIAYTLINH
jgi:hypothetical protein